LNKARNTVAEDSFSQNPAYVAKDTVAKMLQRSEELKKRGQIEQTLKILNSLVTYNTSTEKIYLARAEVYRQKNQLSLALADLTRVIEAGTTNVQAYTLRSEVYRTLNQPKKALADLSEALALEPENVQILGKRGTLYRSLNKFAYALKDYNQAIELEAESAWLYGNRAETYRALNEHRKALNDYTRTLKLNPAATWVYERRSYSNLWLGYINAAQADFRRSWELQPRNITAGWMAEWTGMYKKDFVFSAEVGKRLENIAGTEPEHPVAYLCRAVALLGRGDFSGSYKLCDIACKLAPDEPGSYFWKALAATGLKEDKEAFELLQTALDLNLRPVFLPPPAWAGQINPAFYDKLAQHLFHKPVVRLLESRTARPVELEPRADLQPQPLELTDLSLQEPGTSTPTGPEKARPKLALVKMPDREPEAEQAAQTLQPGETAPETSEASGPTPAPAAESAPEPEPLQKVKTTPEAAALSPARPSPTRRMAQAVPRAEAATKPAQPAPQEAEKEGSAVLFNFFKVFIGLVSILLVCLFFYFLFVVLPSFI